MSGNIILYTLLCIAISILISNRFLSLPWSFLVSSIKFSIPYIYFSYLYNSEWLKNDEVTYHTGSIRLLKLLKSSPFLWPFDSNARDALFNEAGGHHIVYYIWNSIAIVIFGESYYSPILLNILLNFVSGWIFYNILSSTGLNNTYKRGLVIFFLLHIDVLTWMSTSNLKESVVIALTLTYFLGVDKLYQKTYRIKYLAAIIIPVFIFYYLRFYLAVLLVFSTFIWIILENKSFAAKSITITLGLVFLYFAFPFISESSTHYNASFIITKIPKFILTPKPWSVDKDYSFLMLSATLHWLLIIPTFFGAAILWNKGHIQRLLFTYAAILFVFYAGAGLDGPRHRFQLIYVFAWAQFHIIWLIVRGKSMFLPEAGRNSTN